jgi:hypothetical protein
MKIPLAHQTTNCAIPSLNEKSISRFSVNVIKTFDGFTPALKFAVEINC